MDLTRAKSRWRPNRGVSWDRRRRRRRLLSAVALVLMIAAVGPIQAARASTPPMGDYFVQFGPNAANTASLISQLLGAPVSSSTFGAAFTGVEVRIPTWLASFLQSIGAQVTANQPVSFQSSAGGTCPSSGYSMPTGSFAADTGADRLAAAGVTGQGVTVAVLDTGINANLPDFAGRIVGGVDLTSGNSPYTDQYGHGTFVAGLIAGNGSASQGQYPGEAPGANLVSIKVAGASGVTTTSGILNGISWAIKNRSKYGINVLNMSLGQIPTGPTATEPLDQAVESAWAAGITVVVSAGNSGPFNGTVTSPADDPLVVSVGAYADNGSPSPSQWGMCSFSSVGPTEYDGWLKPDLVAPGRSVISLLDPGSTIALANPGALVGTANFVGSGTSFSSAITAGAAALVLQQNPGISPDEVKGRLLGDAMPGLVGNPFVDGHGLLNAYAAATGPAISYSQGSAASSETGWKGLNYPIPFSTMWQPSSWNPANWTGSSWTGSSWTGSSWTGASWNGSSWTNQSWNGSSWTGSSWTGSSWTGSSWTGSSWTGSSWTGSSWTGMVWNGSSWTGSSWTGSSWTGSSWTGSSWTGSSWTGSSWTGSSWTGSSWT